MKRILKHLLWIVPLILIIGIVSLVAYAATARAADFRFHSQLKKNLQISSDSFQSEEEMPVEFSCKGAGNSPNLRWSGAPAATKSYALIAMDWDAPSPSLRLFPVVHWIAYNIPSDLTNIPARWKNPNFTQRHIALGSNMSGQPGYMAPCPPFGAHRYEFRVYALDVESLNPTKNDRAGVLQAMQGHILSYGELAGIKRP